MYAPNFHLYCKFQNEYFQLNFQVLQFDNFSQRYDLKAVFIFCF